MWGDIITESVFCTNYSFGFPTSHSDILLHLTLWQYWFWFWFTYFLGLYYIVFIRVIQKRQMKFNPKIATSFRAHGKWGDFIICLLPLSWCTNILTNSNFILRMIEWQSESSLFTVRIRGKQWYWVYKIAFSSVKNLDNATKNIGSNYWTTDTRSAKNFLNLISYRHSLEYLTLDWKKGATHKNSEFFTNITIDTQNTAKTKNLTSLLNVNDVFFVKKELPFEAYKNMSMYSLQSEGEGVSLNQAYINSPTLNENILNSNASKYYTNVTRINKTNKSTLNNFRILNSSNTDSIINRIQKHDFLGFKRKKIVYNPYLVIKQKRLATKKFHLNEMFNPEINQNAFFKQNGLTGDSWRMLLQRNRQRFIHQQVSTNKRLLRTRRILVLPTNINITLITNSFDVIHSWYVPGLGIKMDCVPGRSTHHTIHLNQAGLYYGQCAEICGRYHHHMPIRVCALPFTHFLIWWNHYGLPYFLAGGRDRSAFKDASLKQFTW